jgi:DNA-binding NtrC family response regulator
MQATALIVSGDAGFAETMRVRLEDWGLAVALYGEQTPQPPSGAEIVLLDIRQASSDGLGLLLIIKEKMPEAEVILINRPDNIPLSIAGMQAGATDELIAPFDTGALKNAISQAIRRRKKRQGKKSLLQRFGDAMAAATFAQAGEFDTALSLLDGEEEAPRPSDRKKP